MFNVELPEDEIEIPDDMIELDLTNIERIKESLLEQLGVEEDEES